MESGRETHIREFARRVLDGIKFSAGSTDKNTSATIAHLRCSCIRLA